MSKQVDSNIEQAGGRLAHLIGLNGTSYAGVCRCLLAILVVLTMFMPGVCLAGEPIVAGAAEAPKPVLSWETGVGKSYLIPALEIPAFLLLLNGYDRLAYPNSVEPDGKKTYDSSLSTFWDHVVHEQWGIDEDAFA